ncbi:MAG: SH3 domain-containing protein [Anaerolineae bacterium]|nr:SH3 domain-containing protein [Anaerolineae bacterium]
MKRLLIGITAFLAAAVALAQGNPTPTQPAAPDTQSGYVSNMPDFGPVPEFANESWLNTDVPLRLSNLRGKVVLLDMWTFECINCIHITPYVESWYTKYADQGLVVIGNHYPEFSAEHDIANIRKALPDLGITYAVTQDNDGATWAAWANHYWPTIYLIDKQGHLRYTHIGEGGYDSSEAAIQDLLKETYTAPAEASAAPDAPKLHYLNPTTSVNVRASAGIDSNVIGSIEPGESFVIRSEENGWYRIGYNDGDGFVSGDLVTVKDEPTI